MKTLRVYAKKISANRWQACCIDLNLVAEGETLEYVKDSIKSQIGLYLCEVKTELELKNLAPRRAPLSYFAEYYFIKIQVIFNVFNNINKIFKEGTEDFLNNNAHLRHA